MSEQELIEHINHHKKFTKEGKRINVEGCYFCNQFDDLTIPPDAEIIDE